MFPPAEGLSLCQATVKIHDGTLVIAGLRASGANNWIRVGNTTYTAAENEITNLAGRERHSKKSGMLYSQIATYRK